MKKIGIATGAGFVGTGAVQAAKYAYDRLKSYQNNPKQMAPFPPTPKQTPRKKRKFSNASSGSSGSVYRRNKRVLSRLRNTSQADVIQRGAKRKGKAVHKEGLRKKLRLPKGFAKKVKQALRPVGNFGTFMDIHYAKINAIDNGQVVGQFGYQANGQISFFSPAQVMHQCAVMWNRKANAQSYNTSDALQFDLDTFKCEVIKQNVVLHFKNNSARDFHLKLFTCSPRGQQNSNGWNLVNYWTDSLLAEYTTSAAGAGQSLNSISAFKQLPNGDRAAVTPQDLYVTPNMAHQFRQNYQIDTTTVLIEPGKMWSYKLEGPQMVYDFKKFRLGNSQFNNQQKFVKHIMFAAYVDVATLSLDPNNTGRWTDMDNPGSPQPFGLLVEAVQYAKIKMPDVAGFESVSVPPLSIQNLNQRKDIRFYQNWNQASQEGKGTVMDINDENPQANITDGL